MLDMIQIFLDPKTINDKEKKQHLAKWLQTTNANFHENTHNL